MKTIKKKNNPSNKNDSVTPRITFQAQGWKYLYEICSGGLWRKKNECVACEGGGYDTRCTELGFLDCQGLTAQLTARNAVTPIFNGVF